MYTLKLFGVGLLLTVFCLCGCKEDIPAMRYTTQGFIEGDLSGTRRDGQTEIQEHFALTHYKTNVNPSYYRMNTNGTVDIYLQRDDIKTGSRFVFELRLDDQNDTEPESYSNYLEYYAPVGDQIFYYSMFDGIITMNDFTFDPVSGKIAGVFSMEIPEYSNVTGQESHIEGSFDLVADRTYTIYH